MRELWYEIAKESGAISVVKHEYMPKSDKKFLGQIQTSYPRKNWSSFIVFNNALCQALTPHYVNQASGLELHRFQWLSDYEIGELDVSWNFLVGEYSMIPNPRVIHYTVGGPWFDEYARCDYADLWIRELDDMLHPLKKEAL
jgi:hypothetical protein